MRTGQLSCSGLAVAAVTLLALSSARGAPLKLIYNASASTPLGWYAVGDARHLATGDLVVVRPPVRFETMMVQRAYLGAGVPLVKHIGALPGARVCRDGRRVIINGAVVGAALDRDTEGRSLPRWSGCRVLGAQELFLLNGAVRDSFDGRYFGPTTATDILGKAHPLWTW